jgi:TRAP-type mannitol/chloroaromatic compound transport system substrate-binding protein
MSWKFHHRNSEDMIEMEQKRGVKFLRTPKSILKAQCEAWDKIIEEESAKNPYFAKVIKSQKEYAARVAPWRERVMVGNEVAYEHWFKKKLD